MKLSIVIFDGVTTLDAIGGYEVLSRLPGIEVDFVAVTRGVIAADTRRLGLLAFRDFTEVTATDILYVPGGPGAYALETSEPFLAYLRALDATSTWTVGICNGVGLLGAAGLLKGDRRRACRPASIPVYSSRSSSPGTRSRRRSSSASSTTPRRRSPRGVLPRRPRPCRRFIAPWRG